MSRAALLLVAVLATCRPTDPRPDVLLIVLDATRADHLSPYGYARDTTPTLARLAADGVVYRRAVAPGTWTVPSHASLFTGRYPSSHGAHRAATVEILRLGRRAWTDQVERHGGRLRDAQAAQHRLGDVVHVHEGQQHRRRAEHQEHRPGRVSRAGQPREPLPR